MPSMRSSILLSAHRMSSPGLRRLRTLVLMTVSAKNLCSHRYVVANGKRKVITSLPIIGFSFLTEVQNSLSNAVKKSCRWNALLLLITRPLPRDGGMAEDHKAPEVEQLSRVWTRGRKETESRQRVSGAKSP